jgi:DNA replication and repair protein RecF
MRLDRLWLTDFRNYPSAELAPAPGLTVITGDNGEGKTNLLEAVGWLATMSSFRGAPDDALVRAGCGSAVVRAEVVATADRSVLIEAELPGAGRTRVLVNRQRLRRARDLLGALRVSVFSPDDLALVKGGPAGRRRWLDDTLVAVDPRHDALVADLDRVLRQRNALLRQAGGRVTPDVAATLDVWDARLATAGEDLGRARAELVERVEPIVGKAYDGVAGGAAQVTMTYDAPWRAGGLEDALAAARPDDLRRSVTTVGPHRDDVAVAVAGLPARVQASQGEQRSLALALRLAAHELVTETSGSPPVLLLDDVFSELDAARSEALLARLPPGQALLATAAAVPAGAVPDLVVRVRAGTVSV